MDTGLRSEYMSQDVLMREMETDLSHGEAVNAAPIYAGHPPMEMKGELNETDGHEYLEYPTNSEAWFYRVHSTEEWVSWTQ
jgi:hypothetical protein